MNKTILTVAMTLMSLAAMAQNDTVTITRPDSVSIVRNNENVSINVFGNGTNSDYRYSMDFDVNTNEPVITKEKKSTFERDLDFGIPVFGTNKEKKSNYMDFVVNPGILWGGTGATGGWGGDVNAFASINIWMPGLASINYHPTKNFAIGLDYGIEWRNYRMTDNKCFTLSEDKVVGIADYPENAKHDFSRIKIFSNTLSLTVRYSFAKEAYLRVGPVFSFNEGLSVKTKWKDENGRKVKEKIDGPKANLFRLEWLADVQYGVFGFFVRYSPNNVLRKGFGPEFSTTTVGVSIGW